MNIKKFVIASIVVYVAFQIMDTIIHWGILGDAYKTLENVWRPDMMSMMWIFYVGGLILSFLFVYIFIKGYENKGLAEGVRYGIIIGLFSSIPYAFYLYAMFPLPLSLCVQWFVYGMIEYIIAGVIAAAIYKPKIVNV